MKMRAFTYHRPRDVAEAVSILAEFGGDAKVLAGGQSLLPMMAMRLSSPPHLVDIARIATLNSVGRHADTNTLGIGANVRHREVEQSQLVASAAPLLSRAAPFIGHRAIRTRGTLCGSLAHGDPAAEWPAVLLALGGEIVATSAAGPRTVSADGFFEGFLTTTLRDDELVSEVRFPCRSAREGSAIHEVSRRYGDFAMCGAVANLRLGDNGSIERAAIALFGVASTPVRAPEAEALLRGAPPSAALFEEAAHTVSKHLEPADDLHATAAYRRHIAGVLTQRCLVDAAHEATSHAATLISGGAH